MCDLTDLFALAGVQAVTVCWISLDSVDLDKLVSRINAGRESVSPPQIWDFKFEISDPRAASGVTRAKKFN